MSIHQFRSQAVTKSNVIYVQEVDYILSKLPIHSMSVVHYGNWFESANDQLDYNYDKTAEMDKIDKLGYDVWYYDSLLGE